jgi:hypothetical protein
LVWHEPGVAQLDRPAASFHVRNRSLFVMALAPACF